MKIVFTSCTNVQDYPNQSGWKRIHDLAPDVLLLLGDQIYMDFGMPIFGGDLYAPATMSPTDFGKRMYQRYRNQFNETNFRAFREGLPNMIIAATWDDHDFAWNNACGGRPGTDKEDRKKHHVPDVQRWLSKMLFRQYLAAVRGRLSEYPAPPVDLDHLATTVLVPDPDGIQESFDIGDGAIRVVMLDTRYHRDCLTAADPRIVDQGQMSWLRDQLRNGKQNFTLICSGTTLSDGSSWQKDYPESWAALRATCRGSRVLALTGDIHKNAFRTHEQQTESDTPLHEAIASGLAVKGYKLIKWIGYQENFGLVEVNADIVKVSLFHNGSEHYKGRISRRNWRLE